MDSKKKLPVKKMGKKQLKSYTLDGVCVADMTKEQLESHVYQLQQEVEREREERNYYQIERDKIQLFWEVSKRQLEEKNAILQLKDTEIDEAALTHLAEIKLYKQKMKHIMFECQQYISEKMKEKLSEKLLIEEEHLIRIDELESELNKMKDEIFQLKINHENSIINQRLKHGEELCALHEKYQREVDIVKSKQVSEIGKMRLEFDKQRTRAIQEVEDMKDIHMQHLISTHEELLQKMKNYYNDIIKNDVLLIKTLKDKMEVSIRKEMHSKETIKNLETENEKLKNELLDLQLAHTKNRKKFNFNDNKELSMESVIRNLKRELEELRVENDFLFDHLTMLKNENKSPSNECDKEETKKSS